MPDNPLSLDPVETARRRVRAELPHYGSPDLKPVQLAEVYARLVAVAVARAAFLGELLAEAYAGEGVGALVGHKYSVVTLSDGSGGQFAERRPVSEEVRALAALEGAERDRAERLTREALKLGIEASRVDEMRGYARAVAEVTRQMAHELRLDWADPAVRRVAQRAVLGARQVLGYDHRSREEVGPRLSDDERVRVLDVGVTPFDA